METANFYFEVQNFGKDESQNKVHKLQTSKSLTANDINKSSKDLLNDFANSVKDFRMSLSHKIELLKNGKEYLMGKRQDV